MSKRTLSPFSSSISSPPPGVSADGSASDGHAARYPSGTRHAAKAARSCAVSSLRPTTKSPVPAPPPPLLPVPHRLPPEEEEVEAGPSRDREPGASTGTTRQCMGLP